MGSAGVETGSGAGAAVTGLPQLEQNFTSSGKLAPHSLQNAIIIIFYLLIKNSFLFDSAKLRRVEILSIANFGHTA
jgi:hypothetical protein